MGIHSNQGPNPTDPYGGYGGYSSQSGQPSDPNDPYAAKSTGEQSGGYTGYDQQSQQQQFYQPPLSAAKQQRTYDAADQSSMKMAPQNAALLSYALLWLGGIFFFLAERKNRFVRFCAAQSFLFSGGVTVVYVILRLITVIPFVGFLLSPILVCLTFVVLVPAALIWLFLMVQAYRGVKVKLPVIGDYAEALVEKFTRKTAG
jgi:uncharacterized membrane protein